MRSTTILLDSAGFPNFWRRSLDEFKRLSSIGTLCNTRDRSSFTDALPAIKLEALDKPKHDLVLWDFSDPAAVESCADMSDIDIGGSSTSSLSFIPANPTLSAPTHARFSGTISNHVPGDDLAIERTGYAAFRTQDRPATLFGKQLWDVERYKYLALQVKSDGRKYKVNVQTESLEFTDLHQHRLYARKTGAWETVLIKWADFVRTNHGIVVEPQSEMMTTKVRTIGIGLTDRLAGPFDICVGRIWATNNAEQAENGEQAGITTPRYVPKHIKDEGAARL